VATDLSIFHLVSNASFLVQLILTVLLVASIASWTLIFSKGRQLKDAWRALTDFEGHFWAGGDLANLHQQIAARAKSVRGGEHIFSVGFRNYLKLRQQVDLSPGEVLEGTRRVMRVELNREADLLDAHLPFLATVGSISPFIGLFGTVWGIMTSFSALGNVSQATLAMVAPGIAEALVATAMGLFAAIPAVIAYNRYIVQVERLVTRYDNFLEEFSAILQRQSQER